jgi:hypothetical protein
VCIYDIYHKSLFIFLSKINDKFMCLYICIYIYIHLYLHNLRFFVCLYVCIHIYFYTSKYIFTYAYTCTNNELTCTSTLKITKQVYIQYTVFALVSCFWVLIYINSSVRYMSVNILIQVYICAQICMLIHILIIHIYIRICTNTYIYIYIYTSIHKCITCTYNFKGDFLVVILHIVSWII